MSAKVFTINILDRQLQLSVKGIRGYEITCRRVKNHLLGLFENINYQDINLFITANNSESELDDNEILDEDLDIICYIE